MTARAGIRHLTTALAVLLLAAACSNLAASTGTERDRIAAAAHTQVQTVRLVAEAALEDPPAPTVTLTVVLDDARTELTGLREDLAGLPGGLGELPTLVDDSLALLGLVQSTINDGRRQELHDLRRTAEEIAAMLADRSETL